MAEHETQLDPFEEHFRLPGPREGMQRDEKSVVRWRTESEHHRVQEKGRFEIFRDYHLRVGDVTFDTHPPKEAPVHERRFDETEVGNAKLATFTEITPEGSEVRDSVRLAGKPFGPGRERRRRRRA